MKYLIGIDGGGTKTHGILADDSGRMISEQYSGSANISRDTDLALCSISNVIDSLLSSHSLLPSDVSIGIGVAGYSVISKRQYLLNNLQQKYSTKIVLNSDCHIACLSAHGKKNGAIVICGTGIVGYYIVNNVGYQIGGWGFPHGDLGGGAWFGLEVCRLLCSAIDGVVPFSKPLKHLLDAMFLNNSQSYKTWLLSAKPSDYASVTAFILTHHISDKSVRHILELGKNEVSQFVQAVNLRSNNMPLKLTGGLSQFYIQLLQDDFSEIELVTKSPANGALLLL